MARKPLVSAACMLLLLVTTAPKEAETQGICTYQYAREPFIDAASRDCNPIGADVTIGCGVNAPNPESFEIRWHKSPTANNAGRVNAAVIRNNTRHNIMIQTNGFKIAFLLISDFRVSNFGYYWCSVAVGNEVLPNPSEVILITQPCDPSAPQCQSPLVLGQATGQRCANFMNNATIPAAPDCPTPVLPSPPTSEPPTTQQPSHSNAADPSTTSTGLSRPVPSSSVTSVLPQVQPPTQTSPSKSPTLQPSLGPDSINSDHMPSPTNVISGDGERTQDSVNWALYFGITIAIVLAAIAIVLVLIVCIQYKKKKLKASTYSVNPSAALHALEEEGSVAHSANATTTIELEVQRDHEYSEIAGFLDQPDGAQGSSSTQAVMYETIQNSSRESGGYTQNLVINTYEDVLPDPAQMGRKHAYDKVEDGSPNYHRLQHENSLKSQASRQSSLKLQLSVQLSNSSNSSSLASAEALQVTRPHIDIYQSELETSSDDDYSRLERNETKPEGSVTQQQCSVPRPRGTDPTLSLSEFLLPMVETMYDRTLHSRSDTLLSTVKSTATVVQDDEENQLHLSESLIEATDMTDAASKPQSAQGDIETVTYSHLDTGKGNDSLAETNPLQESLYEALSETSHGNKTQVEAELNNHVYHELERPQVLSKAVPGIAPPSGDGAAPRHTTDGKTPKREGDYSHLEQKKALVKSKSLPLGTSAGVFKILSEKSNAELGINGLDGLNLQLQAPDSKHTYTPLIKRNIHTYTLPILSTPEKYVSEHGHVYHTLENSREN